MSRGSVASNGARGWLTLAFSSVLIVESTWSSFSESILIMRSAAALAALLTFPAAASEMFRVVGIERGSVLRIRELPEASASPIAEIPWNARKVRGFGCTSDTPSGFTWCRVKYQDAVGWARRRYLQAE